MTERESLILFVYAFFVGAALSLFYDCFRIIRIALYGRKKPLQDSRIPLPSDAKGVSRALRFPQKQAFPSGAFIMIFLGDLLFWVISALTVTVLIFQFGDGRVRAFSLFATALGFTACRVTFGRLVILFADAIISFVKKTVKVLMRYTVYPILRVLIAVIGGFGRLLKKSRNKKIKTEEKNERNRRKKSNRGGEKAVSDGKCDTAERHRKSA